MDESQRVVVVVFRESLDERTCAIVSVRKTKNTYSPDQLLRRFEKAVTKWVNTFESGKEAHKRSSFNYNVGDLAEDIDDEDLHRCFHLFCLYDVKIEVSSSASVTDWSFDTPLINESNFKDS